jgi:hypothetical protein
VFLIFLVQVTKWWWQSRKKEAFAAQAKDEMLCMSRKECDRWRELVHNTEAKLARKQHDLDLESTMLKLVKHQTKWDDNTPLIVGPSSDEGLEEPDATIPPSAGRGAVRHDRQDCAVMPTKHDRVYGRPDDAGQARQRRSDEPASSSSAAAATTREDTEPGSGGIFPPSAPDFAKSSGKGKSKSKEQMRLWQEWLEEQRLYAEKPRAWRLERKGRNQVWIATMCGNVFHVDPKCGKLNCADTSRVKSYCGCHERVPPWRIP